VLTAFFWAFVASGSLLIGGLLALNIRFSKRALGMIMAFGAGTLLSAVAYELMLDAIKESAGTGIVAAGFGIGAGVFFGLDRWIEMAGAGRRKAIGASHKSSLVVPLVLAIILDGIPESTVVGLSILDGGNVGIAMLIAVFISNLPEAIASTAGMKEGNWGGTRIMLLWLIITLVCAASAALGYALLGDAPTIWLSFVKAFAAGAILMMLANTMIPEAYNHGGKLSGVFTVLGFGLSVGVVLLERG